MSQGKGSQSSISIWPETTYGVRPGSPVLTKINAATEGVDLAPDVEKLISNAVSDARGTPSTRGGNIKCTATIPFELPLLGIGPLIKQAVGTSATPSAVELVTLGAGITNVIAMYAKDATSVGAGTLALTGTTLTWAAQGETAGAGVDVAAGGEFTLASSVSNHDLYVLVTGTPVGTSATVTVGAGAYKHVITRSALPVGFGIQVAHADINQFEVANGARIESLSCSIGNSGLVTGSISIVYATAENLGTTVGTPTSLAHVPFAHHECTLMEGGATANVVAFDFNIANELDPSNNLGSRTINSCSEGMGTATGKITTLYEDATMINKVINETASSIRAFFGAASGAGSVMFKFPYVKYYGKAGVGIPTKKGLILPSDWHADSNSGAASDIVVTIINSEATI